MCENNGSCNTGYDPCSCIKAKPSGQFCQKKSKEEICLHFGVSDFINMQNDRTAYKLVLFYSLPKGNPACTQPTTGMKTFP